jgi:hypothetical protein
MYKAFHAALETLREAFARAAGRHADLMLESFEFEKDELEKHFDDDDDLMWEAFVAANKKPVSGEWQEWHRIRYEAWSARFYGNPAGVEEFKRLAVSLYLILCEMGVPVETGVHEFESVDEKGEPIIQGFTVKYDEVSEVAPFV